MSYQIKRECWNEKTYNGYTDNPYWRIDTRGMSFGLNGNGEYWVIGTQVDTHPWWFKEDLEKIVSECRIHITSVHKLKR